MQQQRSSPSRRLAFLLAAFLMMPLAGPAAAEGPDANQTRAIIEAQIKAFQADDGAAAYSYAAPSIRQIFPNPEIFMSMVKSGYQPVYRPKSVTYGRLIERSGVTYQEVFLVGPDGATYTALYSFQQQPDGSWKISGCNLIKTVGESA